MISLRPLALFAHGLTAGSGGTAIFVSVPAAQQTARRSKAQCRDRQSSVWLVRSPGHHYNANQPARSLRKWPVRPPALLVPDSSGTSFHRRQRLAESTAYLRRTTADPRARLCGRSGDRPQRPGGRSDMTSAAVLHRKKPAVAGGVFCSYTKVAGELLGDVLLRRRAQRVP